MMEAVRVSVPMVKLMSVAVPNGLSTRVGVEVVKEGLPSVKLAGLSVKLISVIYGHPGTFPLESR
jgi:hypothetical protein